MATQKYIYDTKRFRDNKFPTNTPPPVPPVVPLNVPPAFPPPFLPHTP